MSNLDELIKKIEVLRKKMLQIASEKGFSSRELIEVSQELDKLLNKYNRIKR